MGSATLFNNVQSQVRHNIEDKYQQLVVAHHDVVNLIKVLLRCLEPPGGATVRASASGCDGDYLFSSFGNFLSISFENSCAAVIWAGVMSLVAISLFFFAVALPLAAAKFHNI